MSENELIPLRALVIDDSRVMRTMIMHELYHANLAEFEFREAESGYEAMGKFDVDNTDIIFVDWNMPGMNGVEFARQIRSMHWANHVPIIMITSETGADKQQNAYDKARITCYVTKPFTNEELKEKIGPVIDDVRKRREKAVPVGNTPPPRPKSGGFFTKLLS